MDLATENAGNWYRLSLNESINAADIISSRTDCTPKKGDEKNAVVYEPNYNL